MGKKAKRFLIICSIVIGAGLLITIIGVAAGGIDGIEKMSNRYAWISGPLPNEEQQVLDASQTFDSIEISGDLDLEVMKGNEDSVKLIYPKDSGSYDMKVENNTLVVNYTYKENVIINLSDEDSDPRLVITRRDAESIKNIKADISWGDVDLQNLTVDNVTLNLVSGDADLSHSQIGTLKVDMAFGDLETVGITCGSVTAELADGDCDLDGTFNGNISVNIDYGDVEIRTRLAESQYTVSARSDYGEIEAGGHECDRECEDGGALQTGNGAYLMQIYTNNGDISVSFGSR